MESSASLHWDSCFEKKSDRELGWFECDATQTTRFLEGVDWGASPTVFLPGAGTSVLVDALRKKGAKLVLNDVSEKALAKLRARTGDEGVCWYPGDITLPLPESISPVDVWVDRAVLHFLLEEKQICAYFTNLEKVLRPGGIALFAEFALGGAESCAGLKIRQYSVEELGRRLGANFALEQSENFLYTNPHGELRPYVYALFRRKEGTEAPVTL